MLNEGYQVVVVTAHPGGTFTRERSTAYACLDAAIRHCESLQADFDDESLPRRAYVIGAADVPVWAGRAQGEWPVDRQSRRRRLLYSNSIGR